MSKNGTVIFLENSFYHLKQREHWQKKVRINFLELFKLTKDFHQSRKCLFNKKGGESHKDKQAL